MYNFVHDVIPINHVKLISRHELKFELGSLGFQVNLSQWIATAISFLKMQNI